MPRNGPVASTTPTTPAQRHAPPPKKAAKAVPKKQNGKAKPGRSWKDHDVIETLTIEDLERILNQRRSHVAPASIRKTIDAAAIAESEHVATMPHTGPADGVPVLSSGEQQLVEPVSPKITNLEQEKRLAFMRERVRIRVSETSEEQADPRFILAVNGRAMVLERGREYNLPRYYVENLARAKPIGYRNEEFFLPDGSRSVRWPARRGLRYPFEVLEDTKQGREWLTQVLKEK